MAFIQATRGIVEFISNRGSLSLVCARPKMLLRDIFYDTCCDFTANRIYGAAPFQYEISDVYLKKSRNRPESAVIIPDSARVKDGWILVESPGFAAYHPKISLQLVWRKNETVFIDFASVSYELQAINENQARLVLKAIRKVIDGGGLQLSAFEPSSFVNWFPVNRVYAKEIRELSAQPTDFDSNMDHIDLRNIEEHAAFAKRLHAHCPEAQRAVCDFTL